MFSHPLFTSFIVYYSIWLIFTSYIFAIYLSASLSLYESDNPFTLMLFCRLLMIHEPAVPLVQPRRWKLPFSASSTGLLFSLPCVNRDLMKLMLWERKNASIVISIELSLIRWWCYYVSASMSSLHHCANVPTFFIPYFVLFTQLHQYPATAGCIIQKYGYPRTIQ